MNLNALPDVASQRSSAPLDRTVGDASDPAFANVMSQVRDNGVETPPVDGSAAPPARDCDVDDGGQKNAATVHDVDANGQPDDANGASAPVTSNPGGQVLPIAVLGDGQPLPLGDAQGKAGMPIGKPALPKTADATDDVDPSTMLLVAPVIDAAPAPVSTGVAVASTTGAASGAMQSPLVESTAIAKPTEATAPQQTNDAAEQLQADLDRLRDAAAGKAIDPRATTSAGAQAKATQGDAARAAAASGSAQQNTEQMLNGGSIAQTLRAFVRPQQLGADGESTSAATGARRDLRVRTIDGTGIAGGAKSAAAHLAAIAAAAAQKDPAAVQEESPDDSIRTDAITPRANGTPEATRDVAQTRLDDLAQLHAQRFVGELADRVLVLRSQRFDSATVTLEPRELGRIDIQVRLQADTTHVAFTAQHAAVRDALEGQLPRLRAMLEDAGLSLGAVDVSHSGGRSGADAGAPRSYEQQRATATTAGEVPDASARWQRRVETSIIDLHA